jgi:hypothetical protein
MWRFRAIWAACGRSASKPEGDGWGDEKGEDGRNGGGDQGADRTTSHWCTEINNFFGVFGLRAQTCVLWTLSMIYFFILQKGDNYIPQIDVFSWELYVIYVPRYRIGLLLGLTPHRCVSTKPVSLISYHRQALLFRLRCSVFIVCFWHSGALVTRTW